MEKRARETFEQALYMFKATPDDVLMRLVIITNALKQAPKDEAPLLAFNCLQGAVLRLAQAYGNADVQKRVDELIQLTLDICMLDDKPSDNP